MTYRDMLIETLAEITGESKETVAGFIGQWEKREPNPVLDKELSHQEAAMERAALRAGAAAPMVKQFQATLESFRSTRRDK